MLLSKLRMMAEQSPPAHQQLLVSEVFFLNHPVLVFVIMSSSSSAVSCLFIFKVEEQILFFFRFHWYNNRCKWLWYNNNVKCYIKHNWGLCPGCRFHSEVSKLVRSIKSSLVKLLSEVTTWLKAVMTFLTGSVISHYVLNNYTFRGVKIAIICFKSEMVQMCSPWIGSASWYSLWYFTKLT